MNAERAIRLLIADDQASVRRSIRRLLSQISDLVVAGEAANGEEALNCIRTEDFDLVLLDLSMPKKSGLDVLRELKGDHRSLPVLVLSIYPADQYKSTAMELGAAGYITKEEAPEMLVTEIRRVLGA